jgi:competence protein ComEC
MKKFLSLILVLILAFGGCASNPERTERPERIPEFKEPDAAFLSVHFMDVGQGDASFVELPNGKTMLIDAGDAGRGDEVVSYVERLGCSGIDFIVATHPHADHIGGMARVIDSFDVGVIFMPNALASTDVFESMLDAAEEKGLKIRTAGAYEIDENETAKRKKRIAEKTARLFSD